jgi:hypothetical protein
MYSRNAIFGETYEMTTWVRCFDRLTVNTFRTAYVDFEARFCRPPQVLLCSPQQRTDLEDSARADMYGLQDLRGMNQFMGLPVVIGEQLSYRGEPYWQLGFGSVKEYEVPGTSPEDYDRRVEIMRYQIDQIDSIPVQPIEPSDLGNPKIDLSPVERERFRSMVLGDREKS